MRATGNRARARAHTARAARVRARAARTGPSRASIALESRYISIHEDQNFHNYHYDDQSSRDVVKKLLHTAYERAFEFFVDLKAPGLLRWVKELAFFETQNLIIAQTTISQPSRRNAHLFRSKLPPQDRTRG